MDEAAKGLRTGRPREPLYSRKARGRPRTAGQIMALTRGATSHVLDPPRPRSRKFSFCRPSPLLLYCASIHQRYGIKTEIKWPNDVLIRGKKVCGILIENMFDSGNLVYSMIGIGINVNFDTSRVPEIAEIATSLSARMGKEVSIDEVAFNLYTELENLYGHIGESDSILAEWVHHMVNNRKDVSPPIPADARSKELRKRSTRMATLYTP